MCLVCGCSNHEDLSANGSIDPRVFLVGNSDGPADMVAVIIQPSEEAKHVLTRIMVRFFLTDIYGAEHSLSERTANPGPYPSYIGPVMSNGSYGYSIYVDWQIKEPHRKTLIRILRDELMKLPGAVATLAVGDIPNYHPVTPNISELLDPAYEGWKPKDLLD
jgi:hypothetical protein